LTPETLNLRKRLYLPLSIVVATIVMGTVGFYLIWRPEHATWLDAFFMTAITVTTIGYGEVHPLNSVGRLWAVAVAFIGTVSFAYSFTIVMDFLVARQFATIKGGGMEQKVKRLNDHVVLAGFGRASKQTALDLHAAQVPFVIVDTDPQLRDYAEGHGFHYLIDDPTKDEVLEKANLKSAKGLIAATESDAFNLYIVLSARVLHPELYIVSLAVEEDSISKLQRAGADRAISSYTIVGHRLARLMLSPNIVDFFDTVFKNDVSVDSQPS
jgi:voltage-gated potassium channel